MPPVLPTNLADVENLSALRSEFTAFAASADPTSDEGRNAIAALAAIDAEERRRMALAASETKITETVTAAVTEKVTEALGAMLDEKLGALAASGEGEGAGEGGEGEGEGEGAGAGAGAGEGEGSLAAAGDAPAVDPAALSPEALAAAGGGTQVEIPSITEPPASVVTLQTSATRQGTKGDPLADPKALALAVAESMEDMKRRGDRRHVATLSPGDWAALPDLTGAGPDDVFAAMDAVVRGRHASDFVTADGELVASGGWQAPSENRYSFYSIEAVDGLLELPEFGVSRGGVNIPTSPSIQGFLPTTNTGLWEWTEADDEEAANNPHEDPGDDVLKTHFKIPGTSFTDYRLAMHGVILDNGNLVARAWPELTARGIALTMAAHRHTVNSRRLTYLAANSTAVDLTTPLANLDPITAFIHAVAQQASVIRGVYRTQNEQMVECVLPHWYPEACAVSISKRANDSDIAFTAAKLRAVAAARNVRLQFVQDWQMLASNATSFGSTVYMLMWLPGTWGVGRGPTIDLGVSRDRGQMDTNDYTAVWTEEALLLAKLGHESRRIQMPVNIAGYSKAAS